MKKGRWINSKIKQFKALLYLDQWKVVVRYEKTPKDDCTAAESLVDPSYYESRMDIYPLFYKLSQEEQEDVIMHELVHCITQPMRDIHNDLMDGKIVTNNEMDKLNEKMTQHITNIVMNRYGAGKEASRKTKENSGKHA